MTNTKSRAARTTLQLTVDPRYCREWGIWEGLRELFQNGQDGHDDGYPMTVKFNKEAGKLVIRNEGVTLGRKQLLLGATTKADRDDQRGAFGEGFKLAWLALLRADLDVWVRSGSERWIPRLAASDDFDGATLIHVDTAPTKYDNAVHIEVRGVTEEVFEEVRARLLFAPGKKPKKADVIDGGYHGSILTNEDCKGQLYANGIWVGPLPESYQYGYDLKHIKLDRDRRLADPWSLKYEIACTLEEAHRAGSFTAEHMYFLLGSQVEEARVVADMTYSTRGIGDAIAALFVEKHGEEAVAVASMSDSIEAEHYALKGIVLPAPIKRMIDERKGDLAKRKAEKSLLPDTVYQLDDLDNEERRNFVWAVSLVEKVTGPFKSLVVHFKDDGLQGTYDSSADEVRIARRMLRDREGLIALVVHEVSHRAGGDATVEHRDAIDRTFAKIVVGLS